MATVDVKVPDIGDFKDVAVIEVLVKPGDAIVAEQSLITVESDKASMEIPSSAAGTLKELKVKVGDKVNIGDLIAVLEGASLSPPPQGEGRVGAAQPMSAAPATTAEPPPQPSPKGGGSRGPLDVRVPDIGDFKDVAVIEVLVQPGDAIKAEQSLITVESDKASMEIPSPAAGTLKELKVKVGDKLNIGDLIAVLEGASLSPAPLGEGRVGAAAQPAQSAALATTAAPPPQPSPTGGRA